MTKRPARDVEASVRQRLLNNAKATNRPFQEVLQYFAMERFLYRLSQSPHADRFVLKCALMFTLWGAPATRPTKDIDFLARMENSVDAVIPIIRAVCAEDVELDGLVFDESTVEGKLIKEDAGYEGVRVTFGRPFRTRGSRCSSISVSVTWFSPALRCPSIPWSSIFPPQSFGPTVARRSWPRSSKRW